MAVANEVWTQWRDACDELGVTRNLFNKRLEYGWDIERAATTPVRNRCNEYALYKGDELIATGAIKELAEQRGVSERTIYFCSTPAYLKRVGDSKRRIVAVKLND